MKAKPKGPEQDDLFRARLVEIIDMRHELVKLAALIDWEFFEREWAGFFPSEAGTIPAISPGEPCCWSKACCPTSRHFA